MLLDVKTYLAGYTGDDRPDDIQELEQEDEDENVVIETHQSPIAINNLDRGEEDSYKF